MPQLFKGGSPVHLVISCLGDDDTGGGLLCHDGCRLEEIDNVSTTGLHVDDDRLVRVLWAPHQTATGTEILQYGPGGLESSVRVDGLIDPHDILRDGSAYVAVSSETDSILWIGTAGEIVRRHQPGCGADCWHLNSLWLEDGNLYASCFGRFQSSREWKAHLRNGTGSVFHVETGRDLIPGICCPHTPRRLDDKWMICSSATSELLIYEGDLSEPSRRVQLQNWPRGAAITDDFIFVGESVNRLLTDEVKGATIAVLRRDTMRLIERLSLPYREVYDLVLTGSALLDGVRAGVSLQRARQVLTQS